MIKNAVEKVTDFLFAVVTKKNRRYADVLLRDCCKSYEKQTGNFCSYKQRSGTGEDLIIFPKLLSRFSDTAIIIQGPLMLENHFTLNTVELYKRYYPECKIIVSTWKDSDKNEIEKLRANGVEIVLNAPPTCFGLGNMNFQIVSTKGGIERAKELGVSYILKTRSDQRIYKPHMLEYFKSLVEEYPVGDNSGKSSQSKRIIALQTTVGGAMFIPFFIADFMYFGTTKDINNLFSIELDMSLNKTKDERRVWLRELLSKNIKIGEYYEATAPEIKIMKSYAQNYVDSQYRGDIKSYWDFVKNYLITLSWDDIGMFWPKYDRYNESNLFKTYCKNDNTDLYLQYNWTFQNWLLLKQGIYEYKSEFEEYYGQTCDKLHLNI